ncbi:MAG: response regulator [Rhodospirillales bacterium]|nr:response regulator [Rhodospirillales bacterium]
MAQQLFDLELTPDFEAPRHAREMLAPVLERLSLGAAKTNGILLSISEVLVNLVKHSDPKPTKVWLRLRQTTTTVTLEIEDNGGSFDGFTDRTTRRDVQLGEDGMGLALLATYCPDPVYIAGPTNIVRLNLNTSARTHILLIDDDASQRRILGHYLSDRYHVTECTSVDEAIVAIENDQPDLILSDLCMPGKTGLDLCEVLHSRENTELIPLIFLSGRQNEFLLSELFRSPIDAFLSKPVSKVDLLDEIERVLNRTEFIRDRLGDRLGQEFSDLLAPSLPEKMGPWRCLVKSRPAASGGGDVVLHHQADDGHLVLFADLMGHGEQAKFFSHVLAGYMHGVLAGNTNNQAPGKILDALSEVMVSDRILSKTILTAQAVYLSNQGKVVIATGGHPFPFLDDTPLDVSGPLPGLMPDTRYEEHSFNLSVGQRLTLYSDGVLENRTGLSLEASIAKGLSKPIDQMARTIFEGSSDCDDGTVAIMEFSNEY